MICPFSKGVVVMGHDRFGRVLMMGDKVRIALKSQGVQGSLFGVFSLYLFSNGKHYHNCDLIREEKISCS